MDLELQTPEYLSARMRAFGLLDENWVRNVECAAYGHDWEDLSECNPDRGDVTYECRRCGRYVSTILY